MPMHGLLNIQLRIGYEVRAYKSFSSKFIDSIHACIFSKRYDILMDRYTSRNDCRFQAFAITYYDRNTHMKVRAHQAAKCTYRFGIGIDCIFFFFWWPENVQSQFMVLCHFISELCFYAVIGIRYLVFEFVLFSYMAIIILITTNAIPFPCLFDSMWYSMFDYLWICENNSFFDICLQYLIHCVVAVVCF